MATKISLVGVVALGIAGSVAVVSLPRHRAHAGFSTVYCTNCSTLGQQASQLAQEVQTQVNSLQTAMNTLNQYKNMVQNTVALPMQMYSQVQEALAQVQSLSNFGSLSGGGIGGIISRLQSASYTGQNLASIPQQDANAIANDVQSLQRMLGQAQTQAGSNASNLQQLQGAAAGATGQMQAIEAGDQLAASEAASLQQIQQTLIALVQAQATQMSAQQDQENAARALDQQSADTLIANAKAAAAASGGSSPSLLGN